MTRWGEIKCPNCAEQDALWEGMERALEESDAREARSRRWREDLERWLDESETREATLNDKITMLEEERDALRGAADEVTEYAKRHEAERDALAVKLAAMEAKEKQRTDWYARQLRVD